MGNSIAILVGSALIAAAILLVFRWDMAAFGGEAYRLDRWTGHVVACSAPNQKRVDAAWAGVGLSYRCRELTPEEAKTGKIDE